jgi:hypothetical protein
VEKMIQKRKRKELYDKFRQGAIPSGADLADLIRSQLNLLDDGIDVSEDPKDPVVLRAHGEEENILDFSDPDGRKRWRISGRSEDGSKEGLNIKADDRSKIYIERETGNVGINTDQPIAKLHIIQTGSDDVLRIDDEGNDTTPLVITSDGQVGIGTGNGDERPKAKLHISYPGAGDVLRVDDTSEDITPFIIDEKGNVGIGYDKPNAKLAVDGGVLIGKLGPDDNPPGNNSLYVEGNITVGGTLVVSGGIGGVEINAPLTARTEELIIKDNVRIIAGTSIDPEKISEGNLRVQGDTTLGTYNSEYVNQNVVTINGRIRSGGDPDSGEEQYGLEVNETLTVNRNPASPQANVKGDLSVTGTNTLGNNQGDDYIYLNGTVQRQGDQAVTIDDNLTVTQNATIASALIRGLTLNAGATVNEISTDNRMSDKSDSTIPTEKAVKEYVDNLFVGSIAAFGMATPPEGWLECNGQAVSRTTYAQLFGRIGTTYGDGDGGTTFNVPDLRGDFVRGWDHGKGSDEDRQRTLGSVQLDQMQGHNHIDSGHSHQIPPGVTNGPGSCSSGLWGYYVICSQVAIVTVGVTSGSAKLGNPNNSGFGLTRYGNETRPRNMALMYCIKY